MPNPRVLQEFKIGDKLRILDKEIGCGAVRKSTEYVIITDFHGDSLYHYRTYDREGFNHGDCYGCLLDDNLEYYDKPETTKLTRRTFKLLKDTNDLTKGALVQENCDDGTQYYNLITPDHIKYPEARAAQGWPTDGSNMAFDRDSIEQEPKWFVEVFAVQPQYMTQVELDQFESFKTTLKAKTKKVKKA